MPDDVPRIVKARPPRQNRGPKAMAMHAVKVAEANSQLIDEVGAIARACEQHIMMIERVLADGPRCTCSHAHGFHMGKLGYCLGFVLVVSGNGMLRYERCACVKFVRLTWWRRRRLVALPPKPSADELGTPRSVPAVEENPGPR